MSKTHVIHKTVRLSDITAKVPSTGVSYALGLQNVLNEFGAKGFALQDATGDVAVLTKAASEEEYLAFMGEENNTEENTPIDPQNITKSSVECVKESIGAITKPDTDSDVDGLDEDEENLDLFNAYKEELDSMTIPLLKGFAQEHGIDISGFTAKDEIHGTIISYLERSLIS